jgi:hypothetical protein
LLLLFVPLNKSSVLRAADWRLKEFVAWLLRDGSQDRENADDGRAVVTTDEKAMANVATSEPGISEG